MKITMNVNSSTKLQLQPNSLKNMLKNSIQIVNCILYVKIFIHVVENW